jgi:adenylate cyclase
MRPGEELALLPEGDAPVRDSCQHRAMMMHHLRSIRPWHVVLWQWFANTVGVVFTLVSYVFVLPVPPVARGAEVVRDNVVLGLGFTALSYLILALVGAPRTHRALDWTVRGTEPTAEERALTLGLPWYLFKMSAYLWVIPGVAMFLYDLRTDVPFAFIVLIEVLASGAATAATSYLITTRLLRAPTNRVLEIAPPAPGSTVGVGERAVFNWMLTTAIPALAVVAIAGFAPWTKPSLERLSITGVTMGLLVLAVGLWAAVLFAKSIGEPLCEVTEALRDIEAGNLDVHVEVNEAGEIGQVQAGLNRMVVALREREQLRDLFGRHVGEDVARQALEHGVELGGEEVEAAALFVDVIGSTTLAARQSPAEVVAALNRFFEVVVSVVDEHGGLVNKFEGDAALCIFGAPLKLNDPAAAALAAAREMVTRLRSEVPELDAGVGVSQGIVIAGNIGATRRLEYTVIGDPVNEAARLTEQAKERPERVVASQRIVDRADAGERNRWTLLEPLLLRGRLEPTVLAVPR